MALWLSARFICGRCRVQNCDAAGNQSDYFKYSDATCIHGTTEIVLLLYVEEPCHESCYGGGLLSTFDTFCLLKTLRHCWDCLVKHLSAIHCSFHDSARFYKHHGRLSYCCFIFQALVCETCMQC